MIAHEGELYFYLSIFRSRQEKNVRLQIPVHATSYISGHSRVTELPSPSIGQISPAITPSITPSASPYTSESADSVPSLELELTPPYVKSLYSVSSSSTNEHHTEESKPSISKISVKQRLEISSDRQKKSSKSLKATKSDENTIKLSPSVPPRSPTSPLADDVEHDKVL